MPTYEYRCDACRHEFEELQSITSRPLRRCPKCRRLRLRRLIGGGAGIIFKGSGFYATDYRSSKGAAETKSKSDAADAGKAKSAGEAKGAAPDKSCGSCEKTGPDVCD